MKFGRTCFSVFLLWVFIFSFLGIVYKLLKAHDEEEYKKVDAVEIRKGENSANEIVNKPGIMPRDHLMVQPDQQVLQESHSKHAYVTLMHGVDDRFSYRGFLYNALMTKQSLKTLGSTADFIVMVGFTEGKNPKNPFIDSDIRLLKEFDIKIYYLPRLIDEDTSAPAKKANPVGFAEMALLKVTPFNFLQYESIQFFDGDVLPYKNMDCLFKLDRNTYNTGNASPLNSGWFLAIPNTDDYKAMKALAAHRMTHRWNEIKGWGTEIPKKLFYRGSNKEVKKWEFNGASLDQGLMTHYFVLNQGRAQLLDTKNARIYGPQYTHTVEPLSDVLHVCARELGSDNPNANPTDMFYHFTGRNKPWLQDLKNPKDKSLRLWATLLDSLNISVNSQTIDPRDLKPPLGTFAANK